MGTALLVIGSMYASGAAYTEHGKWVVIVFIELYAFSFAASWGVVTRLCAPFRSHLIPPPHLKTLTHLDIA